MFKFISEALKEFDHVVWPTNKETKNYFVSVTSVIAILAIILFVVWTIFSSWLFLAKEQIHPVSTSEIIKSVNSTTSWATKSTNSNVKIPTSWTSK